MGAMNVQFVVPFPPSASCSCLLRFLPLGLERLTHLSKFILKFDEQSLGIALAHASAEVLRFHFLTEFRHPSGADIPAATSYEMGQSANFKHITIRDRDSQRLELYRGIGQKQINQLRNKVWLACLLKLPQALEHGKTDHTRLQGRIFFNWSGLIHLSAQFIVVVDEG